MPEVDVGAVPLVVYRIVAPLVAEVIVTFCALVYEPPPGEKLGAATGGAGVITGEVTHTEPGFKGDTATGGTKPAELETGLTINVPLFVSTGDKIRVDTRDSSYIERV